MATGIMATGTAATGTAGPVHGKKGYAGFSRNCPT
jgi:hypothetical protein